MAKITLLVCLGLFGAVVSHSLHEEWRERVADAWEHHREFHDRFDRFEGKWEYEGRFGAEYWGDIFEKCNDAYEDQSPIDLPHFEDLSTDIDDDFDLEFTNFDDVNDDLCELENDGRIAKAICKSDKMRVKGLGYERDDEYIVSEVDFHWGEFGDDGSEHTIGGRSYPMELQLIAYNAKYDDMEKAREHDDGLAVMGVFVKASGESADSVLSSSESVLDSMSSESNSLDSLSNSVSNSLSESSSDEDSIASSQRESEIADRDDLDNDDFAPLMNAFTHIKHKGKSHTVPMDVLKKLLPMNTRYFYRYEGSLTKPPCNKATWTVFRKPQRISSNQMSVIRGMKTTHHNKVNHRPTQKTNGRKIKRN